MNGLNELRGALPGTLPPQSSECGTQGLLVFSGNRAGLISDALSPFAGGSEFPAYRVWPMAERPNRKMPQLEGIATEFLASNRVFWETGNRRLEAQIGELKAKYVFRNESAVTQFILGHRATATVLLNALPELKRCFGEDVVFTLESVSDDDEATSLYAIVVWRGATERAESALEEFDERWWLNQSSQPGLTFTYELA